MRAGLVIAAREIYAFFVSPMAYILLTAWLLLAGMQYAMIADFMSTAQADSVQHNPLTYFFGGTLFFYLLLLVFVPLVTMRLLAEERSRGTLESLMTAPVSDVSILMGKYLAALTFWGAFWVPTLLYVWLTSRFGDIDMGAIGASYFGILVIGAGYLAVGLLMSALSSNQIISAVLTFMVLGMLFIASWLPQLLTEDQGREIFEYMSISGQMQSFSRGVVDTRYVIFNGSIAVFCLILAGGVLSARRTEG